MAATQVQDRGAGAVIVISSHVVRGSVGNRACVFALETLGFPVWAVPTVVLPWHPGHKRATRIVPPADGFAALLSDLETAPWLGEVGAVLSGYLGAAEQAGPVASLVRRVKRENPSAVYLCDPVLGDAGGLYVPTQVAAAQRDALMPLADIATPNFHELAWMAGASPGSLEAIADAAARLGPKTMIVTSVPGRTPGTIGNLLVAGAGTHLAEHAVVESTISGTGDLMAALFLAWLLKGYEPPEALRRAASAVAEVLKHSFDGGADELMLAESAASLLTPRTEVHLRRIAQLNAS